MIGNDQLSERIVSAQNDVTGLLAANRESGATKRIDALSPGHARQFGQTAITIVSNVSGGTGRRSSSRAMTYWRIASRALATASSRVLPCDTHPGRLGHSATQ